MIKKLLLSIGVIVLLGMSGNLPAQTYEVPEILYYKFKNNGPANTPNYAIPGAGSNPANILGSLSLGPGGQFDSALVGSGGPSSSNYLDSGWEMDFGQGSWTISFWISNYNAGTFGYLFGGSSNGFRCFTAGSIGAGNIMLRGSSGFTDVLVNGALPGPSVVHFVYDSVSAKVHAYVDGVLQSSVQQPSLNLTSGVLFKVGGYGGSGESTAAGSLFDEFRVYRRALDSAEVANTWNQQLPHTVTGIQSISTIAADYKLSQNYPNPFNPSTQIDFSIPKEGYTKLEIYNSLGQVVNTLVSRDLSAGSYTATFDGAGLSSGIYFFKLKSGEFSTVKKMNLIK